MPRLSFSPAFWLLALGLSAGVYAVGEEAAPADPNAPQFAASTAEGQAPAPAEAQPASGGVTFQAPSADAQAQAPVTQPPTGEQKTGDAEHAVDFSSEKTYIDVSDAVRSKQYVHRAIITNLIRDTSRFYIPHFYVNHLMGYSSVWQRSLNAYAKYSTGNQQVSFGYVTKYGHGLELGLELSSVSNVYLGYRYFIRPKGFSLWGFVGGGYGMELKGLAIADAPKEADLYTGPKNSGFLTLGLLVPIVDIGIKAEVRISFYDAKRIIFTQGVGIILFL